MRKFLLALVLVFVSAGVSFAATSADIISSPFYKVRASIFEAMPDPEGEIIFLGDSLTDYVKFDELFPDLRINNRGIAGDTTVGVLNRLDTVVSAKPAKLFILIGTNDIVFGATPDGIASNIRKIISRVKTASPDTRIYLQTLLPVNHAFGDSRRPKAAILAVNELISEIADDTGVTLINSYKYFAENDELPGRYTFDGIHLNGAGILHWMELLAPFIKE